LAAPVPSAGTKNSEKHRCKIAPIPATAGLSGRVIGFFEDEVVFSLPGGQRLVKLNASPYASGRSGVQIKHE
jgi:hypothetical protein